MHLSIRGFPRVVMLSARQVVLLTQGRLALCAGRCLYLNPSCLIVTVRLHGAATTVRVDTMRAIRPICEGEMGRVVVDVERHPTGI